jgi:hypothetical protein
MSHDEERAHGVRLKPQPDRATGHWLDLLVSSRFYRQVFDTTRPKMNGQRMKTT